MKRIILPFVLFLSIQSFAQSSRRNETLFASNIESTGYGALTTQISSFKGKNAVFMGIYGGWMINHKFMLGLGGYGLLTHPDGYNAAGEASSNHEFQMGYGGIMLEYTFKSSKRIHLATSLLAGGGGVSNGYYAQLPYSQASQWRVQDDSGYYILQPTVNMELNMTNWFRVAVGGGYRYVTGSKMSGITDAEMSAPMANVSFKFGLF